jgi:DNA repair protein RecO (recombination protein O)
MWVISMLTKTEAIVIRSMKYGDSSKIVTFYTRQFGKLKGIAKAARRSNNKFGSSLEPLSHVALVVYKKEHRDLHLISQCDSIQSYGKIHDSIERISAGLSILELVDHLAHEEEENPALFSLLLETLNAIDRSSRNYQSLARSFQVRFVSLLGYAPALDTCSVCGKSLEDNEQTSELGFQLLSGAIICPACTKTDRAKRAAGYMTLSAPAHRILQRFLTSRMDSITTLSYGESIGNELDETLRLYLRYHFDNMKDLKSTQIFKSMIQ